MRWWLLLPCAVLLLLSLVLPTLVLVVFSVGERSPEGGYAPGLTLAQFAATGSRVDALGSTLLMGGVAGAICVALAVPVALAVSRIQRPSVQLGVLLALVLPFFTSFIVRAYALFAIFGGFGLPRLIGALGFGRVRLLNTEFAVLVGFVYAYLPLAVLAVFMSMERIPKSVLAASTDLGSSPLRTLRRVILPLCVPGMLSGFVLVFVLASGEYALPMLLGGGRVYLLGNAIADSLLQSRNWPLGAALGLVLVVVVLGAIGLLRWLEARLSSVPQQS